MSAHIQALREMLAPRPRRHITRHPVYACGAGDRRSRVQGDLSNSRGPHQHGPRTSRSGIHGSEPGPDHVLAIRGAQASATRST